MNKFLKDIVTLIAKLDEANGVEVVMIIDDINRLYEKHITEIESQEKNKEVKRDDLISLGTVEFNSAMAARSFSDIKLRLIDPLANEDYMRGFVQGVAYFISEEYCLCYQPDFGDNNHVCESCHKAVKKK